MIVNIEVRQEDIDQGKQRSSRSCPVALAAKRVFKRDCAATLWSLYLMTEDERGLAFSLPDHVVSKICQYDDSGIMSPFNFSLEYNPQAE